jgi:hypothetical protein
MYKTSTGLIRGLIPFDRIVILRADLDALEVVCEYVEGIEVESRVVGHVIPIADSTIEPIISTRSTVRFELNPAEDEDVSPLTGPNIESDIQINGRCAALLPGQCRRRHISELFEIPRI